MKVCRVCKEEKELNLFVKSKNTKDGRESKCKKCHAYFQTKYYKQNRKENQLNKVYITVEQKICNRCKINKKITDFSKHHMTSTGYRGTCNLCSMEARKISRDKRYEERIHSLSDIICYKCEQKKELNYYTKGQLSKLNPTCKPCMISYHSSLNKKSISTQFKLSRNEYNEMVKKQNNLCFICGKPEKYKRMGIVKRLCVDHCHVSQATGVSKIRALLCGACNVGLGSFCDSSEHLRKAADYLDFHNENS